MSPVSGLHTCRSCDGGNDLAARMVMASGLSSAFSRSDINGRSRETWHMTSNTPPEQKWKDWVSEVSPVGQKEAGHGGEGGPGAAVGVDRRFPASKQTGLISAATAPLFITSFRSAASGAGLPLPVM